MSMEQLDDDIITTILQCLDGPPEDGFDFTNPRGSLRDVLRFAVCSTRCRRIALGDAVWDGPYHRLADEFELDDQIYGMELSAEKHIPPYAGGALRRPHRTPWSSEDLDRRARILYPPYSIGSAITSIDIGERKQARLLSRICDGSAVQDRFYPTSEKALAPEKRSSIWVTRPLPIDCCGQRFSTHLEFVQYLRSWRHQKHVPEEWCDPRLLDPLEFDAAPFCQRHKRLYLYSARMLDTFDRMMDESKWSDAARANMTKMAGLCQLWAYERLDDLGYDEDEEDDDYADLITDIEGVTASLMVCICVNDFGIEAFRRSGVCGDVHGLLTEGLENYNPMSWGSSSHEQFLRVVFPEDEYPTAALWD